MRKTMFRPSVLLFAALTLLAGPIATGSARTAHFAAVSPAHSDATAALSAAKTDVRTAGLSGLLSTKAVSFTFSSVAGTCPPGTSDASYCLGASGKISFVVVLSTPGRKAVQAISTHAKIKGGSAVSVSATIDRSGLALLRYAKKHHRRVGAALSTEAVLSITAYDTASAKVQIG